MTTTVLILAAGAGARLGAPIAKGFVRLDGRPIFARSVMSASASGVVDQIVLVVPPGLERAAEELSGTSAGVDVVIPGGETRQQSVRLGMAAAGTGADVILCHDAARPFASADLFRRVVAAVRSADGAVPVVPCPDTVKRHRAGMIVETLPRDDLGLAQTPQAFTAGALRAAHAAASEHGLVATDDAMLLEAAGFRVAAVDGEATNFKITTPEDLARAERLASELRLRSGEVRS